MTVSSYEAPYLDTPHHGVGLGPHSARSHSSHRKAIRSWVHRRRRVFALIWVALAAFILPGWLYFSARAPQLDKRAIARNHGGMGRLPDHTWQQFSARRRLEFKAAGQRVLGGLPENDAYLAKALAGPFPIKLKYPILWCGALFSKSGYGTEAVSYVASMLQLGLVAPEDVWVSQSGDHIHDEVLQTMDPGLLKLLQDHHYHNMTQRLPPDKATRPVVVVCHSFPDCWRTPADDSTRITLKKVLKSIGHFAKHKVLGFKHEDSGCPCPHADIQDQVVYRIGRTMFETEHLPKPLAQYAEYVDEVWVPSDFNRYSFAASGIDLPKIHTLAEGINTTLFSPSLQPPLDMDQFPGNLVAGSPYTGDDGGGGVRRWQRRHMQAAPTSVIDQLFNVQVPEPEEEEGGLFRFLSVFKWERRKGWDILMRTYVQEFMGEPGVELHILTKETFEKVKDFPSYFRRMVGPVLNITHPSQWSHLPRVILHHDHVPETVYPRLYSAMDALVIPTHGEGWGRPQIEAMSMGLPVISTNWSGLTAFMSEDIAYPIRISGVVPVQDEGPNSFEWFEGQRWAQPDELHLRHLMRTVFSERRAARRKGKAARQRVLKDFSEMAVARQLLAQVLRIQDTVETLLWGQSGDSASTIEKKKTSK